MKRKLAMAVAVSGLLVTLGRATNAYADQASDIKDANDKQALFKKTDPSLERFFKNSVGYAVFPTVGKGAYIVGGAYGSGVLYEGGEPAGKASLTQASFGFQFGGQAYSELIFFETDEVLSNFKSGNFAFAGQVSAVAVTAGKAANADYQWGVVVFTVPKGGLMIEASVGGQKFGYTPYQRADKPANARRPRQRTSAPPTEEASDSRP
jgi:lipid-binding SYLF domain-containing protein